MQKNVQLLHNLLCNKFNLHLSFYFNFASKKNMRHEVIIAINNFKLSLFESKKTLNTIQCIEGIDGLSIKTGSEFDWNIEEDGDDSEIHFTDIKFYVDGDIEIAFDTADKIVNLLESNLVLPKNYVYVTVIETENILFLWRNNH